MPVASFICSIIPYQELLGNYNDNTMYNLGIYIIPYQELLGNYNFSANAGFR